MVQIEKDIKTLTYRIIITKEEIDRIKSQVDFNALIIKISQLIYDYIKKH